MVLGMRNAYVDACNVLLLLKQQIMWI